MLLVFAATSLNAQDKRAAKQFEKQVAGSEPIFADGERLYRGTEVSQRAIVTSKPEPSFTDLARKKKSHGTVEMLVAFTATGKLKVLYLVKGLPNGLTERALDAASRIEFKPALLDGKPVSQIIRLQYNFNRY